jgi:hypothetical protein
MCPVRLGRLLKAVLPVLHRLYSDNHRVNGRKAREKREKEVTVCNDGFCGEKASTYLALIDYEKNLGSGIAVG